MSHPERNLKIEYIYRTKLRQQICSGEQRSPVEETSPRLQQLYDRRKKYNITLVGAGSLNSPLEVTRFEFTIKSCRCTKTCEGFGTSNFCKAEIAPLPYNSEFTINSEHGRTLFAPTVIWASPTSAKSLRSLRIYIALRARKAVQISFSDITFI